MWRRLLTSTIRKCKHTVARPTRRVISVRQYGVFLLMNAAQVINIDLKGTSNEEEAHKLSEEDLNTYFCELKEVNFKNNEAMRNLIKTLNACIEEICEQYQQCVARQIEITLMCMTLDPIGKHWDELTRYRVEAGDLKREFQKYSMLVERIGQIIYTQTEASDPTKEHAHAVASDYEHLKGLIKQKNDENLYWDSKLLDVNKQSILMGTR